MFLIKYELLIFLSFNNLERINLLNKAKSPNYERYSINEFKYPTNQTITYNLYEFDILNVSGGNISKLESLIAIKGRKLTLDIIYSTEGICFG